MNDLQYGDSRVIPLLTSGEETARLGRRRVGRTVLAWQIRMNGGPRLTREEAKKWPDGSEPGSQEVRVAGGCVPPLQCRLPGFSVDEVAVF